MAYSNYTLQATANDGHVDNVAYLQYLDDARKEWYRYCTQNDVEAMVVHLNASYKQEMFDGEKVRIQSTLNRVGNTSFVLNQTMYNKIEEVVFQAEVVLCTVDIKTRRKVRVPDVIRELLDTNILLNELIHQ